MFDLSNFSHSKFSKPGIIAYIGLIFLLITSFYQGYASPISIGENFTRIEVGSDALEYLEDHEKKRLLDDVLESKDWQKTKTPIANFGYSSSAYWFRFSLANRSAETFNGIIEVQYPILDWVEYYVLDNGLLVKQQQAGDMVPMADREVHHRNPILPLIIEAGSERSIYLRLATESSVQLPLVIWNERDFWTENQFSSTVQTVYFGIMFAMIIYNFFIFLSHRSRSYLLYVGFVFSYGTFQLSLQGFGMQFIWTESPTWNQISLPISIAGTIFFTCLFANSFLKLRECSPPLYVCQSLAALTGFVLALLSFYLPSALSVRIGLALAMPVAIMAIASGLKAWLSKNPLGLYFMMAWIFFLIGTVMAALNKFGILERNLLTESSQQIGSYLEVSLLSFALAYRMNLVSKEKLLAQKQVLETQAALFTAQKEANDKLIEKNREIQNMNQNLETIVAYRTRELKTVFDNIPQGVASLDDNGLISKNYSMHLELILKDRYLSGKSIFHFFAKTILSPDRIARIKESLRACVGEDEINFTVNADNFPQEVEVKSGSESSFYAMTWSPELTDEGVVHSVLLTVEDVTEKKRLEAESEKQRSDMLIIQELLLCDAEKFEIFAHSSQRLLSENIRLIQAGALTWDDIKIMFLNAHTVKGGARTLNLSRLANAVHEAEHQYAAIMNGQIKSNQDSLLDGLGAAWDALSFYIAINRDKLGRKTNSNQISVDLSLIKEHYRLLDKLLPGNAATSKSMLENIREARDEIARLIFKSDTQILEHCLEQAAKIAKDLGKPSPTIRLQSSDIQIPREIEEVIRNALTHILRNALDHGIELPEERASKQKNPAGLIEVKTRVEGGMILIEIQDDGRGMAIGRLKSKGLETKLLSESASVLDIAQTIFEPGISTTQSVSQISGRGVGMHAVRSFVAGIGGSVEINLLSDSGDYIPFSLCLRLPLESSLSCENADSIHQYAG